MSAIKVSKSNFDFIVKNSIKPVLLDFYAEWCAPCRMVSPVVDEIAREHPEYLVGKVNVDEDIELADRFGVVSIPMLVVMKNNEVTYHTVGACSKSEILSILKK
ncbi:MAG: thioredoxin [Ruminococcus sp.]|nr:thioredoxin [Ruminococcus sp.]